VTAPTPLDAGLLFPPEPNYCQEATLDERCVCCELPVESCGKRVEQLRRREAMLERQRQAALPGAFPAAFPGWCARCGEPFGKGTVLRRAGGVDGYVAGCCL